MSDHIVRGIAADGTVRAFAADTTETVAYAAARHTRSFRRHLAEH